LRELKTDENIICLVINMEAGHAGLSGRYQALDELAEEYSFILKVFGLVKENK
jgi:oligopeptidase B